MDTAILILAAGESKRFNSCKLLAEYNGYSLLKRIVLEAESTLPGHVYVVLGANRRLLEPETRPAHVIVNSDWHLGMGGSIAVAVNILQSTYHAVLVVLADQVAIQSMHLRMFLDAYASQGVDLICSKFNNTLGPPALFANDKLNLLKDLEGDTGARALLKNADPVAIDLPVAGIDIDTRSQFESLS